MAPESNTSLTPNNLEIIRSFVERVYEGYNLLPNELPIRVNSSVNNYDNDQQAIKYLQTQEILISYTQSNSHFPAYYFVALDLDKFMTLYDSLVGTVVNAVATNVITPNSIRFNDTDEPVLMWDDVAIAIPKNSLPYWILKRLFEAYPNHVEVGSVLHDWGGNENSGTVSDGVGLVNKRIRAALDAQKVKIALVGQSDSYFRFLDDYFESISTE